MEVYIGRYGRPTKLTPKDLTIQVPLLNDTTVNAHLDECVGYLKNDITKFVSNSDTDLLNIRDEILGKLHQTKYLFTLQ